MELHAQSRELAETRGPTSSDWIVWRFRCSEEYRVVVAGTSALRRRALGLVRDVYHTAGYRSDGQSVDIGGMRESNDALTFLIQRSDERDVATVTLVGDSPAGLPCDEIFAHETQALRASKRRLVETTRLAIGHDATDRSSLILHLFSFVYVGSRFVFGADDMLVEVNPRHVAYYRRFLCDVKG
jgi:hypothetical protein